MMADRISGSRYMDEWNGFALTLPDKWRCDAIGEIVMLFRPGEWEPAALIWPMTLPEPVGIDNLMQRIIREIAGNDPSFEAWTNPEASVCHKERERTAIFRRQETGGAGFLKGMLKVTLLGEKKAMATGIQAPESGFREQAEILWSLISGFEIIPCLPKAEFVEPYEKAFSYRYPHNWRARGGVDRSRTPGGGGMIVWSAEDPSTRAKVSNDSVILDFIFYPSGGFGNPAAMMMAGNPMTAWKVRPFSTAKETAESVLYQWGRQKRPDLVLEQAANDPGLERLFRAMFQTPGLQGAESKLSAGLVYSSYSEAGMRFRECSVICNWALPAQTGMMGMFDMGQPWFCSIGPTFRAPYDLFDRMSPLLRNIAFSFTANPHWEQREVSAAGQRMIRERLNAEQERASILRRTQEDIQRIDREITEHHNAAMDEIYRIGYNGVLGKEDVLNEEGYSFKVDSGYNDYWIKDDSIIGSNSTDFDSHLQFNGWKRMKVF